MSKADEAFEAHWKTAHWSDQVPAAKGWARATFQAAWLARGRADVEAMDALEPCSYDELGYINGYSSALEQAEVAITALDEGDAI